MPNYCDICAEATLPGVSVFKYPLENRESVLKKWKIAAGKPDDWQPTKGSRICEKHFLPDDFTSKNDSTKIKHLEKTAFPTIGIKISSKSFIFILVFL